MRSGGETCDSKQNTSNLEQVKTINITNSIPARRIAAERYRQVNY